jgi:hypothetical protein
MLLGSLGDADWEGLVSSEYLWRLQQRQPSLLSHHITGAEGEATCPTGLRQETSLLAQKLVARCSCCRVLPGFFSCPSLTDLGWPEPRFRLVFCFV